jgi:hypothetical protein
MRASLLATLSLLLLAACRTSSSGTAFAPLTLGTTDSARVQLQSRRETFRGARSLMRVRATKDGRTQSFKAQLVVHDGRRMELVAYTPIGTTALKLTANGERVTVDNRMDDEQWQGDAAQLARSLGFIADSLTPAETSMLILGIPPRDDLDYQFAPGGLASAKVGDVAVRFEPPSFPAQNVTIERGADRVIIEHIEVVSQ